MTCSSIIT